MNEIIKTMEILITRNFSLNLKKITYFAVSLLDGHTSKRLFIMLWMYFDEFGIS